MDPVEVAREGYAAFNRGDVAWIVDRLAPDIVWEDAKEVPGSAVRVGTEHVERYLKSLHRRWDEIRDGRCHRVRTFFDAAEAEAVATADRTT